MSTLTVTNNIRTSAHDTTLKYNAATSHSLDRFLVCRRFDKTLPERDLIYFLLIVLRPKVETVAIFCFGLHFRREFVK